MKRLFFITAAFVGAQFFVASAVSAQSVPQPSPPAPTSSCPVNPGAISAVAGTTELSAGTSLISNVGGAKTLTVILPGTFADVKPPAQSGDVARRVQLPNGATQVTWTLADPARPYHYFNAISTSGVRVIAAINLRGLSTCVDASSGTDVVTLKLPGDLGTARFTVAADGSSIGVSAAADSDVLALRGTLHTASLSGSLTLTGRWNETPTDLGTVSFTANGLESTAGSGPATIDIPTAAGNLSVSGVRIQLTPSVSRASAAFIPVLPAALPFTLGGVDADLLRDAGGKLAVRCAGDVQAFAKAPLIGTPPNLTLGLGSQTEPVQVKCIDGKYSDITGTIAITWPKLPDADAVTTRFGFVASSGGARFTLADGSLPQALQFDTFGLDAQIDGAKLAAAGADLQFQGNVRLALRHLPAFATVQAPLAVAIRTSAGTGQPRLAISCASQSAPPKAAGNAIAFALDCDGSEVVGIKTGGGSYTLPEAAGGGSIAIPPFRFVRGVFIPDGPTTCSPPEKGATSPKAFMSFGALTLRDCSIGYDASTGFQITVGGSLALPSYIVAKGTTLNVTNAVIGYQAKTTHAYGLTSLKADLSPPKDQPLHVFGMSVTAWSTNDEAKKARGCYQTAYVVSANVNTEDDLNKPLLLTLCAEARLPEYLSFESKARVGLLKDGVIPPQSDRPAILHFQGLQFGHDGIVPETDDTRLTYDPSCEKITGVDLSKSKVFFDCRAWGSFAPKAPEGTRQEAVTLGPLSLSQIQLNLVAKVVDGQGKTQAVPPDAPQFHLSSKVAFAKYLSGDGSSGDLTADFDHKHMVMIGDFDKPITVRAGVVSVGLQSFQMELDSSQRRFEAGGVSVSSESAGGVNSTALYFKQITFLETNDGAGWHLKKLSAPLDVPKTALGLAYRLFSDLGASSFLRLFKLR